MKCLQCNKECKNPKFCSHECSAIFNNKIRVTKKGICNSCGTKINKCRKYCKICRYSEANINFRDWSKITLNDMFEKSPTHQVHARIRELSRKLFKKLNKSQECFNCKYKLHMEICHIKPIKEFNLDTPISIVNDISNLICLCPNCHWEFDNKLLKINIESIIIQIPNDYVI